MPPTPAKTPQKSPNDCTAARINDFARKLFAPQGGDLSEPRKRRPINYEMDVSEDEAIEIFSDEGPVPTKDLSVDNPFYGKKAPLDPVKRKGQAKLVSVPGEATQTFEDAANRNDGMIFVFRGKKIFRKFSEHDEAAPQEHEPSDLEYEDVSIPLSQSPTKPKLLFPRREHNEEEEEAVTDVEDVLFEDDEIEPPQTPVKAVSVMSKTPNAPKFTAPVSPPETRRTTRVTDKLGSKKASQASSIRRNSPFDSWQRTKDYKDLPLEKRQGDSLTSVTAKRTRS
ncbi:hypothetical protein CDD82_6453 [Ophiocordyceps australis]|uniref:Uncharacterized protein n=1 Tax=Ophiocordyceps australis TaxID=1399860 RepID=A0A2C5YVH6_9HYPO|nr:hypothetical protein CDD82_6453 [Ophiocordyceps australis]